MHKAKQNTYSNSIRTKQNKTKIWPNGYWYQYPTIK